MVEKIFDCSEKMDFYRWVYYYNMFRYNGNMRPWMTFLQIKVCDLPFDVNLGDVIEKLKPLTRSRIKTLAAYCALVKRVYPEKPVILIAFWYMDGWRPLLSLSLSLSIILLYWRN